MLYLIFILVLVAVVFAAIWLGARAKEAATEDSDTPAEPRESPH